MDDKLANELVVFAERIRWNHDETVQCALVQAYAKIRVARINQCTLLRDEPGE